MSETLVIDVDGHVFEPEHVWEEYLDSAFQSRRPRIVRDNRNTTRYMLEGRLIPPGEALQVDEIVLRSEAVRRLCNGGDVSPGVEFRRAPGTRAIAKDEAGQPVALVELRADRRLWPLRVLRGS